MVVVNSNEDKWKDPLTTREFVWEMFGSQGRDGKARGMLLQHDK